MTPPPSHDSSETADQKQPKSRGSLTHDTEIEKFNRVADDYSSLHAASVAASGEGVEYFASYKMHCLSRLGFAEEISVLDFGCGIGNLTRLLAQKYSLVHGYDPSEGSIRLAREGGGKAHYLTSPDELQEQRYDLAVLAGTLHHIPVPERIDTLRQVRRKLRAGGHLVIFEHNPLNPLTRRAVDACAFDDDAVLLRPREIREQLSAAGFRSIKQTYIVFFPRFLAWFRPLEPLLGFCPLGAQTMTVSQR